MTFVEIDQPDFLVLGNNSKQYNSVHVISITYHYMFAFIKMYDILYSLW